MGLNQENVDVLLTRVRREVDDGLLPSCQVALGYEGEVVVNETFGDATPDSRYCIFSATKALLGYVTNGCDRHEVRRPRRDTAIDSLAARCAA
jgi:CubicO group peptidase (beta-lactamase class C family)